MPRRPLPREADRHRAARVDAVQRESAEGSLSGRSGSLPGVCESLGEELREVIAAGCDYMQFDEPMWTESPEDSEWAAGILNELIDSLPKSLGLHVCGGNPRRKRVYFTKYTDLVPAFRKVKIDEASLEHCTLSYNLMDLWKQWDFKGDLARRDRSAQRHDRNAGGHPRAREAALEYFSPDRLLLTSECGFGHVPLEITRKKLRVLAETCRELRTRNN